MAACLPFVRGTESNRIQSPNLYLVAVTIAAQVQPYKQMMAVSRPLAKERALTSTSRIIGLTGLSIWARIIGEWGFIRIPDSPVTGTPQIGIARRYQKQVPGYLRNTGYQP